KWNLRRERRTLRVKGIGKRVSPSKRCVRTVETHTSQRDVQAEGRDARSVLVQILPDEVVGDGTADPDRCLAGTRRIPGQSGSRFQISQFPLHPGVAVEPRVARIAESSR